MVRSLPLVCNLHVVCDLVMVRDLTVVCSRAVVFDIAVVPQKISFPLRFKRGMSRGLMLGSLEDY